MLRLRFAGLVVFNGFVAALAAAACGSDGGSDIPPTTTTGLDGGGSSSTSTSGGSSGAASSSGGSSGGSSGTSSSGGINDGGADADADATVIVPIQGLDDTFGTNGGYTPTNAFAGHDYLNTIVRQSTGKIVTVGLNDFDPYNTNNDFADLVLGRFTTAGAVDTTFGNAGTRITHVGMAMTPLAATVQTDDKILVVGRTLTPGASGFQRVIVRFTADGALDATFGGGSGFVVDGYGNLHGVGVQSDGKILVADTNGAAMSVIRYSAAGVRDNTYGTMGVGSAGSGQATFGLVVQSDDKAVIAGQVYDNTISKYVSVVARLTTGGVLDTSFNTTGRATAPAPTGTANTVRSFDIDDQGRFILESSNANGESLYTRFTSAGLDATFGTGGTITLSNVHNGFLPEAGGKLLVAYRSPGPATELRRYDSAGALDTTYNGTGSSATPLPVWVFLTKLLRAPNGDGFAGGGGALTGGGRSYMVVSHTAADGTVDSNYGPSGRAVTGSGASRENPLGVAVQSDGKIVVAGGFKDFWHRTFIQRYTAGGLPDTTFGTNGFKETSDVADFQFSGFALTPAGKFLMALGPTTQDEFAVVQYNADGTRDNAYGSQGKALLAAGVSTNQGPRGIVVDNDVALVRFTTAGLPDTTFGGGTGYVKSSFTNTANTYEALQVAAVRADGKIVAAGQTNNNMVVARYEANGTPDNTFDTDGFATFGKAYFKATAVLLQPDDKIIVVGLQSVAFVHTLIIARITSAGALDTTWNGTGLVEVPLNDALLNEVYAPAVRNADGTVLVGVATAAATGSHLDMIVSRYTTAGVLDGTFGTGGKLTLALSSGDDVPTAFALQPDGKLVVTGRTWTATGGNDALLLRLK